MTTFRRPLSDSETVDTLAPAVDFAARAYLAECDADCVRRKTLSAICHEYGLYHDLEAFGIKENRLGDVLDRVAELRGER